MIVTILHAEYYGITYLPVWNGKGHRKLSYCHWMVPGTYTGDENVSCATLDTLGLR